MIDINENPYHHVPSNTSIYLGKQPSRRELQVMGEYVLHGHIADIGTCMNFSYQTAKNHLSALYTKIGASGSLDALRRLGWVEVPGNHVPHHSDASAVVAPIYRDINVEMLNHHQKLDLMKRIIAAMKDDVK